MTRAEYIETIIKIFRAKYKPSEVELEEFKLMLEMMPDKPILNIPNWPKPDPIEQPVVVMYGCGYPQNDIQYTSTSTAKKDEEGG